MPDLAWNKQTWDGAYNWENCGEEWSVDWGGSEPQWFGTIYPRIHRFIPAEHVLEIAPGFGRWTKFILPLTRVSYTGIDLSETCIKRCKSVFENEDKANFYLNDGLSLDLVPDSSIDFVFSFDSLVHAEIDVLKSYIPQIIKKLRPKGVAFIHHSNRLDSGDTGENPHCRADSVSAAAVASLIQEGQGEVFLQEVLNWGSPFCIDCFSVFGRADGPLKANLGVIKNQRFLEERALISQTQSPYSKIASE